MKEKNLIKKVNRLQSFGIFLVSSGFIWILNNLIKILKNELEFSYALIPITILFIGILIILLINFDG